jgi:integrase
MASVYRKKGASGKQSPYWQAKIRGLKGRQLWLSTKVQQKKAALQVAELLEKACRAAEDNTLSQTSARQIVDRIGEITKSAAALKVARDLIDDLLKETVGEGGLEGQNFERFCEDWLLSKKNTIGEATWLEYRPVVTAFVESLMEPRRSAPVASITSSEIQRFRDNEIKIGKSAATVNLELRILRSLFNTARRQELTLTNRAETIDYLSEAGETRIPFTPEAVKELLAVADIEWRGMILLGYDAGLRLSDAANLTWANIDLVKCTLSYAPRKTARRKKRRDRSTTICLHPDLLEYFTGLGSSDEPAAPLFPSLHGVVTSGTNGLSATFSRLMERAGLDPQQGEKREGKGRRFSKVSYHSLRHSFVSRLANAGIAPDLRKKMVGHASDAVHDQYTHWALESQLEAIKRLGSVLS